MQKYPPRNFSWLLQGEVAGCSCPHNGAELLWLRNTARIKNLVSVSKVKDIYSEVYDSRQ